MGAGGAMDGVWWGGSVHRSGKQGSVRGVDVVVSRGNGRG